MAERREGKKDMHDDKSTTIITVDMKIGDLAGHGLAVQLAHVSSAVFDLHVSNG